MNNARIAVICPTRPEYDAVRFVLGEDTHNLKIFRSGVGKSFAAATTAEVIASYNPQQIYVCGVAGAICSKLELCEVVIGQKIVHGDMNFLSEYSPSGLTSFDADRFADFASLKEGFSAKVPTCNYRKVKIASLDSFADEAKKDWLGQNFNAEIVDMESAAILQIATLKQVPVTVVRAISDTRNESYEDFETNLLAASKAAAKALVELI